MFFKENTVKRKCPLRSLVVNQENVGRAVKKMMQCNEPRETRFRWLPKICPQV